MTTLAVDTSSKACSCALVRGGTLLAECYLNVGLTHSATLMRLVGDTLGHAGLGPGAVDRLAVTVGPGSYTGLRIGMAAVKGMALAGDLPCVGVSTLLSLAYNLLCFEGMVCAALDARVGLVFAALFSVRGGEVSRLTEPSWSAAPSATQNGCAPRLPRCGSSGHPRRRWRPRGFRRFRRPH